MNRSKLISVVVPVYNVESLVQRCVQSLIRQTYDRLQIILVDDGSTDLSGAICDRLAQSDSRIEVLHTENGGLSAARNAGMKRVKGDGVVFVDSDDFLGLHHIESLLDAALAHDDKVTVAVTGSVSVSADDLELTGTEASKKILRYLTPAEAITTSLMTGGDFASHAWGKLYPKELFPLLEYPVGRYYEDQFVTYKVFLAADVVVYESSNDYGYTIDRSGSISNSSLLHRLDYLDAIRAMRDALHILCPEAFAPATLRYFVTLASSVVISTMSDDPDDFGNIFTELASVRHNALALHDLPIRSRLVYCFSFCGARFSRSIYSLLARLASRHH